MSNFEDAVHQSAHEAVKHANDLDKPGDPATHITPYVNGTKGFVRGMKKHGVKSGDSYTIGPVTVSKERDGYVLKISGLKGTNIQNHNKKRALYQKFEEQIKERGWKVGLDISTYAR